MKRTTVSKCRWQKPSKWFTAMLVVLISSAVQAQKTTRVEIFLKPCNKEPRRIWFVLNGSDSTELDRTMRHWRFVLPEEDKFAIQYACASLRLGGARTDCRRPVPVPDPDPPYASRGASLAQFTFGCDEADAWPVAVTTSPSFTVSYVRQVDDGTTSRDPRACPCREADSFSNGMHTFQDVRLPSERLTLQLGVAPPNDKSLGLKISSISVLKHPRKKEYTFSLPGVAGLLLLQRAKSDSSPPSLSSTAIDIDSANLKRIPLKQLTVTVN